MDNQSNQAVTDGLRVSLILRTIFQHFSRSELLELALVNKFWSYEARSLLRDRGSLVVSLNRREPRACQDLRALASDLRQSKAITGVLPFSGLSIYLEGLSGTHTDSCTESSSKELSEVYDEILGQMTWKYLSVEFSTSWTEEFISCPGFLLLKKLKEKFGCALEELALTFPSEREDVLQQIFQSCCFPRLNILRIEHSDAPNEGYTNWIKTLVSRSPNLKLLETYNHVNLNDNLLEGSTAVHITGHLFSPYEIPEYLLGTFYMSTIWLAEISQDFQLEKFNRITSGSLVASRTTMTSMFIDVVFLVPLATYGICLENVVTLQICLDQPEVDDDPQPNLWRLVKSFDFTNIFPNLRNVQLEFYSECDYYSEKVDEIVEQGMAAFKEPTPDRAVNIEELSVESLREPDDSGIQLLAEMFPDVEIFSTKGIEIPLSRILESWPNFKALNINDVPVGRVVKNLDSVCCGIFPEEVAQLREQDEEYLRRVHIVPVMPSIATLKELRTLRINFRGYRDEDPYMGPTDDPSYLFSKVTGLIAFQRCPNLTVTLTSEDERLAEALGHLRPYASVVFQKY